MSDEKTVFEDEELLNSSEEAETPTAEESAPESEELEEELSPIAALEEEVKVHKDKYIRLMAEFDNFKKRTAIEYEKRMELASERLMKDLISVKENFDRAMSTDHSAENCESFYDGLKMIYNSFMENLEKHGLKAFAEIGDDFDPAIHDAMMKQANDEIEKDKISQVFEKGYYLNKNIIKHAKVVVSDGPAS